jgi:hypothetical protein
MLVIRYNIAEKNFLNGPFSCYENSPKKRQNLISFHNCPLEENEIRETVVYTAYFAVYNLFIK